MLNLKFMASRNEKNDFKLKNTIESNIPSSMGTNPLKYYTKKAGGFFDYCSSDFGTDPDLEIFDDINVTDNDGSNISYDRKTKSIHQSGDDSVRKKIVQNIKSLKIVNLDDNKSIKTSPLNSPD